MRPIGVLGVVCGLFGVVLLLSACSGLALSGILGGNSTTPATWLSYTLSNPPGGVPAQYFLMPVDASTKGGQFHIEHLDTTATDPAFVQLCVDGYHGPGAYHQIGKLACGAPLLVNAGPDHVWDAGAKSSCTYMVTSDRTITLPGRVSPDGLSGSGTGTHQGEEIKGTFSCQALQPVKAGDGPEDILGGAFYLLPDNPIIVGS